MDVISFILNFVRTNPIISSILGGMFAGEEAMMILTVFSSRGYLSFWIAFTFFIVGTLIMDSCIFFIARSRVANWLFGKKKINKFYSSISFLLDRRTKKYFFLPLLVAKSLYGTGIAMIVYLGRRKISYLRFLINNILVTIILASVMAAIGLMVGEAVGFVIDIVKSIEMAVGIIVIIIILLFAFEVEIKIWLKKTLTKNHTQINTPSKIELKLNEAGENMQK